MYSMGGPGDSKKKARMTGMCIRYVQSQFGLDLRTCVPLWKSRPEKKTMSLEFQSFEPPCPWISGLWNPPLLQNSEMLPVIW